MQDMFLIAAMGPPGGGRNFISNRLMARFNIINMTFPNESQIIRIFLTMLQQHLSEFDAEIKITGELFLSNKLIKLVVRLCAVLIR